MPYRTASGGVSATTRYPMPAGQPRWPLTCSWIQVGAPDGSSVYVAAASTIARVQPGLNG